MAVPTESERKQSGTRLAANCSPELPSPFEGFWPPCRFVGAETVTPASPQALARAEPTCFSLCAPTLPDKAKHRQAVPLAVCHLSSQRRALTPAQQQSPPTPRL
ncbi:hypothetical protein LOK74_00420 [Brevibacillus humidisoli]|uniref:hypothetical protein n=1 Tax=Brevibacillus humidisoli TaxID=2895522 RepID=UPI001E64BD5D|nr:hypothetical protein [Brevibacillus humidisoli]UFJ41063.1 hypothetical protein LOK74_00420 [Brevibacillus humidisoli]